MKKNFDLELAKKIFEAILVSANRKVNLLTLKKFFEGIDIEKLIEELNKKYKDSGFFIYKNKNYVELVNKPELSQYLINFFGFEENENIQEFLEILAIIAYGGPIELREIDKIRGKKSFHLVKELLNNGLIKKENRKFYQVTSKFLEYLGFKEINELPDYDKLREEIKRIL